METHSLILLQEIFSLRKITLGNKQATSKDHKVLKVTKVKTGKTVSHQK